MKKCTRCALEKTTEDFYRGRGKCKLCHKKEARIYNESNKDKIQTRNNAWYSKNKDRAKKLKKAQITKAKKFKDKILNKFPCRVCGFSDIRYLEFDHINSEDKRYRISSICSEGRSLSIIKQEMRKCQVLCVACHKEKTKIDIKKSSSYFSRSSRKPKVEYIDFLSIGVVPAIG